MSRSSTRNPKSSAHKFRAKTVNDRHTGPCSVNCRDSEQRTLHLYYYRGWNTATTLLNYSTTFIPPNHGSLGVPSPTLVLRYIRLPQVPNPQGTGRGPSGGRDGVQGLRGPLQPPPLGPTRSGTRFAPRTLGWRSGEGGSGVGRLGTETLTPGLRLALP